MILGSAAGLAGAAAVGQWADHATAIQMMLYSIMVLGPLGIGLWSDRHESRFWAAVFSALVLHCLFLLAIQRSFPFRTILVIVPVALAEATILCVLMLKILGW